MAIWSRWRRVTWVGAGLHVAAYYIGQEFHVSETATVASIAIPTGLFVLALIGIYHRMMPGARPFHLLLVIATAVVAAIGVLLAAVGVPFGFALTVVTLAPWLTVAGYEALGHRHIAQDLSR